MKKILVALLCAIAVFLCACQKKAELTGISVNAGDAKYWYLSGQEIDPTGLHITASYSDGTEKLLSPMIAASKSRPLLLLEKNR